MDSDLQYDSGRVCRIAFVDNEAEHREIVEILNDSGHRYDVVSIPNGESLFDYLHKTGESLFPNVIVLDRISGEMNALDILRELKKNDELARIPVIIHSSILSDRLKTELLKDGAEEMTQTESVFDALKQFVSRLHGTHFTVDKTKISSMKVNTPNSKLEEYFITALKELYWSEVNLVNVLTTMTEVATSPQLQEAFRKHAEQTADQVIRLDDVFSQMNIQPEQAHSVGLQGLFDEGWKVIDETEQGPQRDMALIIAAQKVEHYEMACYGSMSTLARTMGRKDIAKILDKTLQEEKDTDQLLTQLAESNINQEASEEPATA